MRAEKPSAPARSLSRQLFLHSQSTKQPRPQKLRLLTHFPIFGEGRPKALSHFGNLFVDSYMPPC
jgi:hypothetical protein